MSRASLLGFKLPREEVTCCSALDGPEGRTFPMFLPSYYLISARLTFMVYTYSSMLL